MCRQTLSQKCLYLLCVLYAINGYGQSSLQCKAGRSIELKTLKQHVYTLAADSMAGRETATAGYAMAAGYVARVMKRSRLQTVLKDDQGLKTYQQGVPFWRSEPDDFGSLKVTTPEGAQRFVQEEDFKFDMFSNLSLIHKKLPLVYVGYGVERGSYSDYAGLDLEGKVAVMISRIPMGRCALPDSLAEMYRGGRRNHQRLAAAVSHGAVAVIRIADRWTEKYWKTFGDVLMDQRVKFLGNFSNTEDTATRITVRKAVAASLFNPQAMPLDSTGGVPPYRPSLLTDIQVQFIPGKSSGLIQSPNLVGVIRGTDAKLRDEYIVVGAHLDHIGSRHGEICNGADDNASGVAALLEVTEAVALRPLKRSVLFVAFTGEEKGLLGSKYFIEHTPVPLKKIGLMINLDMMGRSKYRRDSSRTHEVYYSREGRTVLNDLVKTVNAETVNWALDLRRLGRARSDHAPFVEEDIPALFFFSGTHGDYHRPTDDADKIDYDKLHALTKLVYALVARVADAPEPLLASH